MYLTQHPHLKICNNEIDWSTPLFHYLNASVAQDINFTSLFFLLHVDG